jgi:hypothetical protein
VTATTFCPECGPGYRYGSEGCRHTPPGLAIGLTDAGRLVGFALDTLHAEDQDEGCCPECCAPCAALSHLAATGQLDRIAGDYVARTGDCDWWDRAAGWVNRAWLDRAWRMTDCHDDAEDGQRYTCCGKTGRISRHESWCVNASPPKETP